jgi:hypothetical protein
MTIETTRAQHKGRNIVMIEEAIQELVRKGLVVDSGQRRWSKRTGRYIGVSVNVNQPISENRSRYATQ